MSLSDSRIARWTVLIIVATAMMMGYFVNDVMSPLETLLELPRSQGGLGWTSADYGFFSGSSGLINVFLLMLFFSGLILDKMGVRFTGTLACSLMVGGVLIKLYGMTAGLSGTAFGLPMSAAVMSLGFAIFGVGYEMCGISVSKSMVRWFTGHELALAMGIQLAMARLGTAAALSLSAPVARHFSLSTPLWLSLSFLLIGLVSYLVFCVMDRRLDASQTIKETKDESDEFRLSDIGRIVSNPGFWLITLFVVLFYSAVSPFLKFASRLMVMKYGVDASLAGIFTSVAPFGTIVLTPLFGSLYDRKGHGVSLIIAGTLMLVGVYIGFALPVHDSSFALALMVVLAVAYSLAPATLWPCVPKIIPLKCLGTAYSMIFFIQNFGRSIIPMLVGKANMRDPSYTTAMIIFALAAAGALFTAIALLIADKKKGYGLQKANIKE